MTPFVHHGKKIGIKVERDQAGSSHKYRAAAMCVRQAEAEGLIAPDRGDVLLDKSGGNFGQGLVAFGRPRGYQVELLVRPSFSAYRRALLESLGATLIGRQEMADGWTNDQILKAHLAKAAEDGRRVHFVNQFNNPACVAGHRQAGRELARQLQDEGLTEDSPLAMVVGVGTGASLMGYALELKPAFPKLQVILAEPEGCDLRRAEHRPHAFEGVSVGVGVPPLLDPALIDGHVQATAQEAEDAKHRLFRDYGLFLGLSSHLVFAAALKVGAASEGRIVMIGYDGGEAYFADRRGS